MDILVADDDDFVEVDSSRIYGIGYGTFTTLILFFFIVFVWLVSEPLRGCAKWSSRLLSVIVFAIVFLLMVFAERGQRYQGQGIVTQVSSSV